MSVIDMCDSGNCSWLFNKLAIKNVKLNQSAHHRFLIKINDELKLSLSKSG